MRAPVTIVSARFEDLVAIGLHQLISEDTNLQLVEDSVELEDLEDVLAERRPNVVLLNFGSLPNAAWVYQLHQSSSDTRIVVLANRPTAADAKPAPPFELCPADLRARDPADCRRVEPAPLVRRHGLHLERDAGARHHQRHPP